MAPEDSSAADQIPRAAVSAKVAVTRSPVAVRFPLALPLAAAWWTAQRALRLPVVEAIGYE